MELTQHDFLEELLAPIRRDNWNSFSTGLSDHLFSTTNTWSFDSNFDENPGVLSSSNYTIPSFSAFNSTAPTEHNYINSFEVPFISSTTDAALAYPFVDGYALLDISSPFTTTAPLLVTQEDHNPSSAVNHQGTEEDHQIGPLDREIQSLDERQSASSCKLEIEGAPEIPVFDMGLCEEKRIKTNKLEKGQPSKNLMAERRRRKRLNDRLSMLRSIVPKISKMDRTSILGDTIDYVKELLERISKLREENGEGVDGISLLGNSISNEPKSNEVMARNSTKFDVERRDEETHISICCATKPGLVLSTVNSLESLGLEIQQCVISCFNDFSMQATCSEVAEQKALVSSEDIKQALFRTAGYGGRYR